MPQQISSLPIQKCSCGHEYFHISFLLRQVPAMLSQSGQPELMPKPVYRCDSCESILTIKDEKKKTFAE